MSEDTKHILVIDGSKPATCELCGITAEVRPYGPNGENVCFDCGMKDEKAAERAFAKLTKGKDIIIIK